MFLDRDTRHNIYLTFVAFILH
ncbi:BgTH12-00664 [Blumeria graminis f. sp. triticale]|uniref:Bgt-50524 n=2 Tax=Blumeria graminis TaxID=34373 RepID=A0A9X9MNE8_BLUGR|nr:BgTH12-00664 [Blumeria graminis f. sp. triticale]VDB93175.1 Bgt-50524 [Blumeria graminis f. sp. tritici]